MEHRVNMGVPDVRTWRPQKASRWERALGRLLMIAASARCVRNLWGGMIVSEAMMPNIGFVLIDAWWVWRYRKTPNRGCQSGQMRQQAFDHLAWVGLFDFLAPQRGLAGKYRFQIGADRQNEAVETGALNLKI